MGLHDFQIYWWIIVSILGGALTFLLFVQGGQTMIYRLSTTPEERDLLVNLWGHQWEYTFTTLVVFGGAFFASFPLFYATSFGGAYAVWIILLFSFVIQAVSYEYRRKPNNVLGRKTYDSFLQINGYVAPFLIGIVVATFFTGSPFRLNRMMQMSWTTPWRGLDALFNFTNYFMGFSVLFLSRTLALLYAIYMIDDDTLYRRCKRALGPNALIAVVCLVIFLAIIFTGDGYAVVGNGVIQKEAYKYWINFLEVPINSAVFLLGICLVLTGILTTGLHRKYRSGIWFSSFGTLFTVVGLFGLSAYNGTAYYPSYADLNSSLTLANSSSSLYTLRTMAWISLAVPIVTAYIWYSWRAITKGGMNLTMMKKENHEHMY